MTDHFEPVSFQRQHHTEILRTLRVLDGDLLSRTRCYFGGGTAIALNLGEYRESIDIDFLCSDREGYRELRTLLANKTNLHDILRGETELTMLRDVRADQYGLRTWIKSGDAKIKFEIVREARIDLKGDVDPRFGVPVLDRDLMYAEKLLANSDRYRAPEVLSRDIIDLSVMISRWGPVPDSAWDIAQSAYGEQVRADYEAAIDMIRAPEWIAKCAQGMAIDGALIDEILSLHGGPKPRQPPPFE